MAVARPEWADYLVPGARSAFSGEYPELSAQYPTLYNIETSTRAWEEDLVSTGLGTAGSRPEGEEVPRDKPVPRGKVRYTHTGFGLGYEVTEEMTDDDLYGVVVPPSSRYLARAMRDAEELTAAGIINALATTTEAYDGVAVLSDAHPAIGVADQANKPSTNTDMSVAALQGSLERFMLMKDDRGLRITMQPQLVVHHPNNYWLVREILQSEFKPFTANNEINALREAGLQPFSYSFLTDTNMWFTMATGHKLNWFWRKRPIFDDEFISKNAGVMLFYTKARWTAGITDWRGIDGSPGA